MNVNRQSNCCSGRSGKPNVIIIPSGCNATPVPAVSGCNMTPQPVSSCCNAAPVPAAPCCSAAPVPAASCCNDGAVGAVIVGGCADTACNKETTLRDFPVAMAYVPWQDYGNIYALPQALKNGTIFRELDLDFAERRCN